MGFEPKPNINTSEFVQKFKEYAKGSLKQAAAFANFSEHSNFSRQLRKFETAELGCEQKGAAFNSSQVKTLIIFLAKNKFLRTRIEAVELATLAGLRLTEDDWTLEGLNWLKSTDLSQTKLKNIEESWNQSFLEIRNEINKLPGFISETYNPTILKLETSMAKFEDELLKVSNQPNQLLEIREYQKYLESEILAFKNSVQETFQKLQTSQTSRFENEKPFEIFQKILAQTEDFKLKLNDILEEVIKTPVLNIVASQADKITSAQIEPIRQRLKIVSFVLIIIIVFITTVSVVYLYTSQHSEQSKDTCIPAQVANGEASLAFIGVGTNTNQIRLEYPIKNWNENINRQLEQKITDLNRSKGLEISLGLSNSKALNSLEALQSCSEEVKKNWMGNDGLVSFITLDKIVDNSTGEQGRWQISISFNVSDKFLSDNKEFYINELKSSGYFGAPILLAGEDWIDDSVYRNRIAEELATRIAALGVFKIGIFHLSKGEYSKALEKFNLSKSLVEGYQDFLNGYEVFETWIAWTNLQIERSQETPNFQGIRLQHDSLIAKLKSRKESYAQTELCRTELARANVEYYSILNDALKDFNLANESTNKALNYFDEAENCYNSLSENQKLELINAEILTKINIGRGQLLSLVGYGLRDGSLLNLARNNFDKVIKEFETLPVSSKRIQSLRPFAAHAYATTGLTVIFDYEQGRVGQDGLLNAETLYRKAIDSSPPDSSLSSSEEYRRKRLYLTKLGYLNCLQQNISSAVEIYKNAQRLVSEDNLRQQLDEKKRDARKGIIDDYNSMIEKATQNICSTPNEN